jgi:hypothetical protein
MSRTKPTATASESASQLTFPKPQQQISRDIQVTVAGILASHNDQGQRFASTGIDFAPISILAGISNLYLNKKYGTNCYMYGSNSNFGEFIHGGFRIDFSTEQIPDITPDFLESFIAKNLSQIKIFLECVKKNNPVIIIPLGLIFPRGGHHANMLIYKRALNTIEHFEPHGSSFETNPDYGDKIKTILQALVDEINKVKKKGIYLIPGLDDITFVPSNEVCIRHRGLQAIQEELKKSSIEQGEYCQMWSFLFAELALLNPTMTSRDILDEIFRLLDRDRDAPRYLLGVIRGYVSILGEEISIYLSEYINNAFTIENISYIFRINPPYAGYLSKMLEDIIYSEVNAKTLVGPLQLTIPKIEEFKTRLQDKLSNYFRVQQEVKDLITHRKCNYSVRDERDVDGEIIAKLDAELAEFSANRNDINRYISYKVFKNFLISQSASVASPAAAKAKSSRKGGKKYKKTKKNKKSKKYKKSRKLKR